MSISKKARTHEEEDVQKALRRYSSAIAAFNQARNDSAVDYAIYEMEAAHRQYALLSAEKRGSENALANGGVQAEYSVV